MKYAVIGTLAISAFLNAGALAADLPRKPAPAYIPPPPAYVWTGCYVGGNIGGAWGNAEVTDVITGATVSPNNSGFAGGGQFGCDYQMGQWVVGIRNLIDGTSIHNGATISDPGLGGGFTGTVNSKVQWFDTLTARAGFLTAPNILLYVQGGAAWNQWSINAISGAGAQVGEISGSRRTGWTVGGGVEWMFVPHWSAFLEYNFMGFGTNSNAFTACVGAACNIFSAKADLQNVLVGVNYKF